MWVLVTARAAAQAPKFSTDVNVVNILANVFDQRGQLIQNLSKDDFVVEETAGARVFVIFRNRTGCR